MSAVEVRFKNLSVDADVHVGGRALPTVLNSLLNVVEVSALGIHSRCHLEDQDSGLKDSCNILCWCLACLQVSQCAGSDHVL